MTRIHLVLAAALTALPLAAFAQGTAGGTGPTVRQGAVEGTAATQPGTAGESTPVPTAEKDAAAPAAGKRAATETRAASGTAATGTAATGSTAPKTTASAQPHAAVKKMPVAHAHAVAPTGIQVKRPETPKS